MDLKLGDVNAAIKDFHKAVEHNPKLAFSYNNLGSAYRKNKKYNDRITINMK